MARRGGMAAVRRQQQRVVNAVVNAYIGLLFHIRTGRVALSLMFDRKILVLQQALSTQGSELANEAREQMKTQLEAFRQHLQDFAVKYKVWEAHLLDS